MSDKHHVAEAQDVGAVRLLSDAAPNPGTLAVSCGIFDGDRDLPDPGDTLAIIVGDEIVRGTVAEIVVLVEPAS